LKNESVKLYSVMHNRNPGILRMAEDFKIEKETNVEKVLEYAVEKGIDLAVIGPEAPLQVGLTDVLEKADITVCAPTRDAARIETNKEWMRELMRRYRIPGLPKYETFTDISKVKSFIESLDGEVAVKPIGLTGGKGVKVAGDHFSGVDGAVRYAEEIIKNKIGGEAKVLIEEKCIGEEFTLQAFSDGRTIFPMPAVQDHKRLLPDDKGPNTGGMGSYSCENGLLPFMERSDYEEGALILQRIVEALSHEECPFVGPIYGQFMLTADGVKVIEINARFGDPEAMNVLPLLQNDFVDICYSMVEGKLNRKKVEFLEKATVCKYVVPEGYGVKSMENEPISVNESAIKNIGALLYYASVNIKNEKIYTTSSRSLAVVGIGNNLSEAEMLCEEGLKHIQGEHIFIRHDIGTEKLIEKRILHMKKIRG
ncbi:MAG TPA: phosphoribosylamine--glycine ligase, partial [Thermoplasmatales archaeon]|nr:phosphoribosylamine--glycine ligase [Thermoplasmatales archaeon]